MATRENIPFSIEEVARVMGLQVKRTVRDQLYCKCPFCDDRSGHLNINLSKDVFRCPRCGTQGGILDLYAKYHQITKNTAYSELCDLIGCAGQPTSPTRPTRHIVVETEEVPLASAEVRNNTYSNLMAMLSLGSLHKESLLKRGMNCKQVEWAGYRTTPAVRSQKIVTALLECGCSLEGVPGFYIDKTTGRWELDIRGSGIMLPDRNIHGEIEAIQIRLDKTVHSKFNNLTSAGKYFGATSACCPHYVGYCSGMDTVYVTEGVMKSDIAYCLSRQLGKARAFVGLTGVANTNQYMRALTELSDEGVRRIILAFDSDAEYNPHVAHALRNAEQLGIEHGFDVYPLCWDPHFKGIDDLMLSFREY